MSTTMSADRIRASAADTNAGHAACPTYMLHASPPAIRPLGAHHVCRRGTQRRAACSSGSVAHLEIQLLTAVVPAVVKQRGAAVGPNVNELSPQVITFAGLPCGLRNVFDPLNRLGRE